MISLTTAAVVRVGGPSNARTPGLVPTSAPAREAADVAADLRTARQNGATLAVLAGGEPTLRRDLLRLLKAGREQRLAMGLVTNGRTLSYPQLRQRLLKADLRYLRVALHAADAELHDRMVGVPGAFEQTWKGLAALLTEATTSLRVDVSCVVTADNVDHLDAFVDRVTGVDRRATLTLRFIAPLGGLPADGWPAAETVSEKVSAAIVRADAAGADIHVGWEGFPPCQLDAHAHQRDELLRYGVPAYGPDAAGGDLHREDPSLRSHPYPCQECLYEPTCPGAPAWVLEHMGESALQPTKAVRANSFNYELERELPDFHLEAGNCSARELDIAGDPARWVLLQHEDKTSLYTSPSSDFTDGEIRYLKDELEQIYVDLSPGAALFDFMETVRRVRFHDECRSCPDRATCGATMTVVEETPFGREERWLRKEVSRVLGRVLDVGCGEQPYREEIAEGIRSGRIEYHGLDPDQNSLDKFREAGVGGELHLSTIEDFDWESGYFDYILAFRSWNHFHDLERSMANIARLLRPQGQFYACDSLAFGMLRTPSQVEYADENAPHGHEHFRNWSSQQVVDFIRRYPFRLDVHRPVGKQTSNQWLVKAMRVADPTSEDKGRRQ